MNSPGENDAAEDGQHLEFLEWVVRYQDGTLSPAEVQKLAEMISSDPTRGKLFRRMQIRTAAIHDVLRMDAFGQSSRLLDLEFQNSIGSAGTSWPAKGSLRQRVSAWKRRGIFIAGFATLSLLGVMAGFLIWQRPEARPVVTENVPQPISAPPIEEPQVILFGETRAKFFGQAKLSPGDVVTPRLEYLLQSGIIKLKFPSGATAIIEAPSIFQVASQDRLLLSTGGCSVHAPPGAEGFEVLTPQTKVVDRGTRFYVNVQENSETEVHVIEGAADLYSTTASSDSMAASASEPVPQTQLSRSVRLTNGEAIRVGGFIDAVGQRTVFQSEPYRARLPDRLVSYTASSTSEGNVDELTSVTVQRDGQLYSYSADELVPIQVTWYRTDPGPDSNGFICGFPQKPARPEEGLEDRNLTTGLINFGGQRLPLKGRPVIGSDRRNASDATPGLGIRFRSPVVNHAGPDFVFFEIQSFSQTMDGDSFHVYPMSPDTGRLRPLTVTKFDLTMESPVSRVADPLWSHRYESPMSSIAELKDAEARMIIDVGHLHFWVIGVGVDLSEMGYAEGELVEELFFQHASAGGRKVDPVFIAGLPPVVTRD